MTEKSPIPTPEIPWRDQANIVSALVRTGLTASELSSDELSPEGHAALWQRYRDIAPKFADIVTLCEGVARVTEGTARRYVDDSDFRRIAIQKYDDDARDLVMRIAHYNAAATNPEKAVDEQRYWRALNDVVGTLQGSHFYPMPPVTVNTVMHSIFSKKGFLVRSPEEPEE